MKNSQKLAIISDFHMDINHFDELDLDIFRKILQQKDVTDIHFAGDISNEFHNLSLPFLDNLEKSGFSVSSNLGNHDMVGLSEKEIGERDFGIKWFGNTVFVWFHGWYDYSFMDKIDLKKIVSFKNAFYFDRKIQRDFDDMITAQNILEKLDILLENLTNLPKAKRIIISTHFVPHKNFIINTRYEKFARFNAYLGSEHFHNLFTKYPKISDVVFGHAHYRRQTTQLGEINYHSRPLGYTYEWQMVDDFLVKFPEYQIPESYHLRKRYKAIKNLPEWKKFRQQQLSREFADALTLFEF